MAMATDANGDMGHFCVELCILCQARHWCVKQVLWWSTMPVIEGRWARNRLPDITNTLEFKSCEKPLWFACGMRHLAFGFITQSLGTRHCICRLIKPTAMEKIDVTCGQSRNSDAIIVIKVLVPDHKVLGVLEFVNLLVQVRLKKPWPKPYWIVNNDNSS